MTLAGKTAIALAAVLTATAPAAAQWTYAIETDATGLEYARAAVDAPESGASLYAECTERLDLGLALILVASEEMVDLLGGVSGQVLYLNERGDNAIATVSYAAGENRLTLVTPERDAIEAAWSVFVNAGEAVVVRFTFPPEPQVYEVKFPAEGVAEAMGQLDAYCR